MKKQLLLVALLSIGISDFCTAMDNDIIQLHDSINQFNKQQELVTQSVHNCFNAKSIFELSEACSTTEINTEKLNQIIQKIKNQFDLVPYGNEELMLSIEHAAKNAQAIRNSTLYIYNQITPHEKKELSDTIKNVGEYIEDFKNHIHAKLKELGL
jgi:uncharacterized protein YwgA